MRKDDLTEEVTIINHYHEDKSDRNDVYFIISFKKTLLIIQQSHASKLRSLFLKSTSVSFCFLSDCRNNFIENCEMQLKEIKCHQYFEDIEKRTEQQSLASNVECKIIFYNLLNKMAFEKMFDEYRTIDFLYDILLNPILSSDHHKIKADDIPKYPNAKNISDLFREGFGFDY